MFDYSETESCQQGSTSRCVEEVAKKVESVLDKESNHNEDLDSYRKVNLFQ